jgi:hypothetical protein
MRRFRKFVTTALMSGLLILPSYLAVLLMLKGVKSLAGPPQCLFRSDRLRAVPVGSLVLNML